MKTLAAMLLMGAATTAQGQNWWSYSYIEAQGGLQLTSTNAPMDKLFTPTAALSLGHYFTPVVGARLHVNAWQSKSGFADLDQYYKWKYITPDLDLMVNMSNLFSKRPNHVLNVILLGGVGLNYAWDNDELKGLAIAPQRIPMAWDDNRLGHNIRAGLRLETYQAKPLGLSLEINANSLDDRFNSKANDADDWQFTAMLGLSYRFGYKGKKHVPQTYEVEERIWVEEPYMEKVAVRYPFKRKEEVKLHKEVFYDVCISDNVDPSAIQQEVAQFMNECPEAKVYIVGYADKGTGNTKLNKMYAAKRAETFKKDLVEKYGLNPENIITDSKGDTVQPFEENDKNRCVIIDATGEVEVIDYEEGIEEKPATRLVEKIVRHTITE